MFKSITYWKENLLGSLFCICSFFASAQEQVAKPVLGTAIPQGRVQVMDTVMNFGRLPIELKDQVRKPVWGLGQNSAGVYLDFKTSAKTITVRYQVQGGLAMPHMPTTGVSGLDLYVQEDKAGQWSWIHGKYSFKDTISYTFSQFNAPKDGTFRLYLPLYNTVSWMDIIVDKGADLSFQHQKSKPIIVYGTSIAQGACASRPGLAWTNWLGRSFDKEVINLAFSGNGRLEQPILDLIKVEDAAVFILDCIPNLGVKEEDDERKLIALIENAVQTIREKHFQVPIVMAAHSSSDVAHIANTNTQEDYQARSKVAEQAIKQLQDRGDKNLYWISSQDFGLDLESTVDYAHPNDYGMDKIAKAYVKLLKGLGL
ncbi:SGNH/GDSL hydrolase family protein [Sphingobacterium lactis]|uniref:SGNH/GDSL hydrolase family protein n=1 Tax=Sphingobacterium lactis TaxID=797291 RepID=UPI003EC58F6F